MKIATRDGRATSRVVLDPKIIRKLADLVALTRLKYLVRIGMMPLLAKEVGLPPGNNQRHRHDRRPGSTAAFRTRRCARVHPELRDPADMYLEATDQHRGWLSIIAHDEHRAE